VNPTQKIIRSSLPKGFMRNGFFAWPATLYKCPDCGVEFENYSGMVERCQMCRAEHKSEYQK
jgi:hypothetical protein